MSSKKTSTTVSKSQPPSPKKSQKTVSFSQQYKEMLGDIKFMYQHFFHWNLSKITILWASMLLGFLLALPFFLLSVFIGLFDPIQWQEVAKIVLYDKHLDIDIFTQVISHPFWLWVMLFCMFLAIMWFLLGASYYPFLLARVSDKYVDRKCIKVAKNVYFDASFIKTYLSTLFWSSVYGLIPICLFMLLFGIVSLMFNAWILSLGWFKIFVEITIFFGVFFSFYVFYRVIFGYIILAHTKKKDTLQSWYQYVKQSMSLTKKRSFWKFAIVIACFIIFTSPIRYIWVYLENEWTRMKQTISFKSGIIKEISPKEQSYYEFLSSEYDGYTQQELLHRLQLFSVLELVYVISVFMILNGLGVMTLVSFYRRVLI